MFYEVENMTAGLVGYDIIYFIPSITYQIYEVFRKNFFAHMNELEITPGKVRLDEAIRLIVCQMSDFLVPYVISIN